MFNIKTNDLVNSAVIPAHPGWFLLEPVFDYRPGADGKSEEYICEYTRSEIIAWVANVTTDAEDNFARGYWIEPMTVDTEFGGVRHDCAILTPRGTVVLQRATEYKSLEDFLKSKGVPFAAPQ